MNSFAKKWIRGCMAAGAFILILRAAFAPPVHASGMNGAEGPGLNVPRQPTVLTINGDFHAF